MLAHGASAVILDRLFKQSDEFECWVCRRCGLIAESIPADVTVCIQARTFCRGCRLEGAEHIARVQMPYSMKLLAQARHNTRTHLCSAWPSARASAYTRRKRARARLPSVQHTAQEIGGMNVAMRFRVEEKGRESVGL